MAQDRTLRPTQHAGTFFRESPTPTGDRRMEIPPGSDDSDSEVDFALPIQGATGPVGDVGLPPPRPVPVPTPITTRNQSSLPHALSQSRQNTSRDGSSEQTHVPNLTPAAFYNPLSSRHQREQQRPRSPTTETRYRRSIDSNKTIENRHMRNRHSNASIVTVDPYQRPLVDADAPPVPLPDPRRAAQSPTPGAAPAPLSSRVGHTPVENKVTSSSPKPDGASARSPRAIGAAWGKTVRNGLSIDQAPSRGHKRLSSGPSSPEDTHQRPAGQGARQKQGRVNTDRNWEYYNGNAIFFLHGRLINARTRPLNVLTAVLALSPALFFFIFCAPYLWHHVSPAIPIFFAYLIFVCGSALFHASFSDPGILPRNLHKFPPAAKSADPLALGPSTVRWVHTRSFAPAPSSQGQGQDRSQDQDAPRYMEMPSKFCESCNIWRPPRTHHCRICDACIETQDHHCVWLNNCVGRRNYRFFFTFVVTGVMLAIYLLGSSAGMIQHFANQNNMSFGQAIGHDWSLGGAFFLFLYSFPICAFPASLSGYHLWLMSRGETTREYLHSHKFRAQDRHRPYDQYNVRRNLGAVLCRPRPPTYMQFKVSHDEGDQRFNDAKSKQDRAAKEQKAVEMKTLEASGDKRGFLGPRALETLQKGPRTVGRLAKGFTSRESRGATESGKAVPKL